VTLTSRLNLFFLSALALVLVGFSSALYLLARQHLHRQADERLDSAFDVLAAAVETTPNGIEWEPSDRKFTFGSGRAGDSIVWLVTDPDGRAIDRAGPADVVDFANEAAQQLQESQRAEKRFEPLGNRWQFRKIRIESPTPVISPKPVGDKERTYSSLGITVGISLEPIHSTLRELAAVLVGLSVAIWLVAMIAGRFVCRRALRPVILMAKAAHDMDAGALEKRLPYIPNGDELEDLARAFNGLLGRVQEAFERQQRFTGDASHQLRTPLAALRVQIEVTVRRERTVEEYQRVLKAVLQQADRLEHIVEALLFLARADAEAQLPERENIDLARWLPNHLQSYADHPRFRNIVTRISSACVSVHPVLLGELLNILLDNAFKYSSAGSSVTIGISHSEKMVELSVEDMGSGIADEDIPQLFDPFFRAPAARLKGIEGFGLGLSVAKRIAAAFGGTLSVTSQLGKGSRFSLRLLHSPGLCPGRGE
jgi:heavy metal sensor kinase